MCAGIMRCLLNGRLLPASVMVVVYFLLCLDEDARVHATDDFYFSHHPRFPDLVLDGQFLQLTCQVSVEQHIVYHWMFNNKLIENTARRYQNRSTLVFAQVHRGRDTGQYQCVALNTSSGFTTASSLADLRISWVGPSAKVAVLAPKTPGIINEGNALKLKCVVEGSGYHVKWYRNSVQVSPDLRIVVDEAEHTLTIEPLSVHDNGIYSCEIRLGEDEPRVSARNFPLTIARPDVANVRVLPQDLIVQKGSAAHFDCVYENARRVEWFYHGNDEAPMKNTTKGHVIFPNGTLYFPRVQAKDAGSFRCAGAVRDEEELVERPTLGYLVYLKIVVRPEISAKSFFPIPVNNRYVLRAGATLEVFCRAKPEAQPPPVITWVNSRKELVSDSSFWLIESVQPSHAGEYTCRAHNGYGSVEEYTVSLIVTILPDISQEPESSVSVDEEKPFQLFCAFKGSPGPLTSVNWMRSRHNSTQYIRVESSARHKIIGNRDGSTSQLLVNASVAAEDSGNYRCQIITQGFDPVYSEISSVVVRERLRFTAKPLNQHLELATKAKINCRAHATETVRVKWTKEGRGGLPNHVRAESDGTLVFDGVRKTDEGGYVCTASTRSEQINATARVEVVVSPRFLVRPVDTKVYEKRSLLLECSADGDPKPTVSWDKEGQTIPRVDGSRWRQLENGSLYNENIRPVDEGRYGCTVGNKGGFKREEMELTVQLESVSSVVQTIIITFSFASGYILLVVGLIVYCKRKRSRKAGEPEASPLTVLLVEPPPPPPPSILPTTYSVPESTILLPSHHHHYPLHPPSLASVPYTQYERQSSSSGKRTNNSRVNPTHLYEAAHLTTGSDDPRHSPNTSSAYSSALNGGSHLSRRQLLHLQKIGRGQFGDVFTAHMSDSPVAYVAVKALQSRDADEFNDEFHMYSKLNRHPNVVQCLGMCRATQGAPKWAVYEHTEAGNLKSFLQANSDYITPENLLSFAWQIASGMQHLDRHRFIHRDLAARNCVVDVAQAGTMLTVKVANLMMSSDSIHEDDYGEYRNRRIPLRWMPAEAVLDDEFSSKSDVWSFGVVCYELVTRCQCLPFDEFDDDYLLELLGRGTLALRMDAGQFAEVRTLINRCMAVNVKDRPTFDDILAGWRSG